MSQVQKAGGKPPLDESVLKLTFDEKLFVVDIVGKVKWLSKYYNIFYLS